ncbi:hypothetical protein Tco_0060764 [Tanacetum coccineum]
MLAIPLHSKSISMAEIVSKEAQKKSMAGIRALKSLTKETQERRAEDLAVSINRRLCEPKPPQCCLILTLEGFPFVTINTKEYHSECSSKITRIMRRTLCYHLCFRF